jgi:hypothetical protein
MQLVFLEGLIVEIGDQQSTQHLKYMKIAKTTRKLDWYLK